MSIIYNVPQKEGVKRKVNTNSRSKVQMKV